MIELELGSIRVVSINPSPRRLLKTILPNPNWGNQTFTPQPISGPSSFEQMVRLSLDQYLGSVQLKERLKQFLTQMREPG